MSKPSVDADAFNAFEAAGWEKQVSGYEDFFGPITTRLVGPLLDAAEVDRGARVLDVASGPGYVAAAAAERGAFVIGVDIAEGMISRARRLHPHSALAWWRYGPRTPAAQLRLRVSQKETARSLAVSSCNQTVGRQADCSGKP